MDQTTTQRHNLDALSKKGTCIEFFSAYQDLDIERMLNLCAEEGTVFFEPLGEAGKGRIAEKGRLLWTSLMECFPDLDNTVRHQELDEQSNIVRCYVSIFGTQTKDFAGIPSAGLRFESDHIFIFRFNDQSKIEEIGISWDHEAFVRQLTGNKIIL
jgi:predicted ester cyclase